MIDPEIEKGPSSKKFENHCTKYYYSAQILDEIFMKYFLTSFIFILMCVLAGVPQDFIFVYKGAVHETEQIQLQKICKPLT